jgi:hypothetical protein
MRNGLPALGGGESSGQIRMSTHLYSKRKVCNLIFIGYKLIIRGGYNNMSVEEQIKILCVKKDISLSELARLNNISPQNFSQKLKRNTLTVDDLKAIADKLECTYQTSFVLPNGEKVEY